MMCDFRFPLHCKGGICCSGMLHGYEIWWLSTKVLGQSVSPILNGITTHLAHRSVPCLNPKESECSK
jgi:hypothetical protein